MNRKEILEKAVAAYGSQAQTDMMLEEMSELAKALLKYRRADSGAEQFVARANICEEMADVQIVLDQMRIIFGDTVEQELYKLDRLAGWLNLMDK